MLGLLGLLAGMGQGLEEKSKADIELQKQTIGLDLLKSQIKADQRKQDLIETLMGMKDNQSSGYMSDDQMRSAWKQGQGGYVDETIPQQPTVQAPSAPQKSQNPLVTIIEKASRGDQDALAQAAILETVMGMKLSPYIENARKGITDTREKRRIYDPATRQTYEAIFDKTNDKELPGTRIQVEGEDIKTVERSLPGGSKELVGLSGRNIVPLGGSPPALGPTPKSAAAPFDISLPGATDATATKIGQTLGGIITQQGATTEPIKVTELPNWINPITGKHPAQPMSTDQLQAQGFVPYQKLTGEQAPRFAKAVNALDQLPTVANWLFKADGSINPQRWMAMKAGIGEGARMKGTLLQAAWAQIRNESGAAVTDKEVSDLANQYVTNALSVTDPQGMYEGIQRLGADLKGYVDIVDPTGIHQNTVRKGAFKLGKPSLNVGKGTQEKGGGQVIKVTIGPDGKLRY